MTQNNLTDAELATYTANKAAWFKGTIAVCVVYGVFAIGLLAIALSDVRGRQFLSEDFLPFTITFVGGMIVVIILLVIQITSFKPKHLETILYDREICPDYWKAIPSTKDDLAATTNDGDSSAQQLMKMKCVPDPDVFALDYKWSTDNKFERVSANNENNVFGHKVVNSGSPYNSTNNKYIVSIPANATEEQSKLLTVANTMYSGGGNVGIGTTAIRCDMLFPAYMAKEDELTFPNNPNTLRCNYAKLCGLSWSSVC